MRATTSSLITALEIHYHLGDKTRPHEWAINTQFGSVHEINEFPALYPSGEFYNLYKRRRFLNLARKVLILSIELQWRCMLCSPLSTKLLPFESVTHIHLCNCRLISLIRAQCLITDAKTLVRFEISHCILDALED